MRPRDVIRGLVKASRASHVVFKALCELQELKKMFDDFAPAKGIWIIRNFEDVVNSHIAKWTGMPSEIAKIVKDRNAAGWRGRGMSDATHALVKKLYYPELSIASASALFWYFRNVLFFEQALDRDPRVLLIRYETMVTEPTRQFAALFDFLGLRYTSRVASAVFASSIRKSAPPEIAPRIREVCEGLTAKFDTLFSSRDSQ
jgi:hypothetical protein